MLPATRRPQFNQGAVDQILVCREDLLPRQPQCVLKARPSHVKAIDHDRGATQADASLYVETVGGREVDNNAALSRLCSRLPDRLGPALSVVKRLQFPKIGVARYMGVKTGDAMRAWPGPGGNSGPIRRRHSWEWDQAVLGVHPRVDELFEGWQVTRLSQFENPACDRCIEANENDFLC